jgi:hypothetical protein
VFYGMQSALIGVIKTMPLCEIHVVKKRIKNTQRDSRHELVLIHNAEGIISVIVPLQEFVENWCNSCKIRPQYNQ